MAEEDEAEGTSTRAVLKQRSPPWEMHASERVISSRDHGLLKRYDVEDPEVQADCLRSDGVSYCEAMLNAATSVSPRTNHHTLLYTLALMDDMLTVDPSRASLFHKTSFASNTQPAVTSSSSTIDDGSCSEHPLYGPLLRLIEKEDFAVQEKVAKSLACIVARRPASASSAALGTIDELLDWTHEQLNKSIQEGPGQRQPPNPSMSQQSPESNIEYTEVALRVLCSLLVDQHARDKAMQKRIVPMLARASTMEAVHDMSPQQQYDFALVLWLLSFNTNAISAMAGTGILQGLLAAVKSAAKEKVARVGLMALRNLLEKGDTSVSIELAEHGLPRLVTALKARSFADEELNDALEKVSKQVDTSVKEATSFDKYKSEVMGGKLEWSRVHSDEAFWKEHVGEFEENEWQIVKQLLSIINSNSSSPKQLQVAAHDLGCFATHHPRGRNVLADLRGKGAIIGLMQHSDPEVKKHALLASQRVLIERTDFLNAQGNAV